MTPTDPMKLRTNPAAGLLHDELEARQISAAKAARDMAIPRSRLSDIFNGRKGVSADTALRFERYLGVSAGLLIRLQSEYDLSKVVADKGAQIQREILPAPKLELAQ
jgi:addiction module HigA family antidote